VTEPCAPVRPALGQAPSTAPQRPPGTDPDPGPRLRHWGCGTGQHEDGVYYGENRTGLPLPLDGALQPSCGKRMPSLPAHEQKRTAEWRMVEQPLAAIGHRLRSKQPARDTNSLTKQKYIWLHDAYENPRDVLATKKHHRAQAY
jgi:hypothetical protein